HRPSRLPRAASGPGGHGLGPTAPHCAIGVARLPTHRYPGRAPRRTAHRYAIGVPRRSACRMSPERVVVAIAPKLVRVVAWPLRPVPDRTARRLPGRAPRQAELV